MKRIVRAGALVVALALWSGAGEASAQAWIGIVVAETSRAQAEFERACQAAVHDPRAAATLAEPAEADYEARRLVASYFTHASARDQKKLAKLFWRWGGQRWRDPAGERDVRAIVDAGVPQTGAESIMLERVAFIRSFDGETARGVWKVGLPDPAAADAVRSVWYGIDFTTRNGGWRILHMTVYAEGERPKPPVPYCHLHQSDSY